MYHLLLASALFASQNQPTVRLESLNLSAMTTGWGDPHAAQSVEGHTISLGGKLFDHGVGSHSASEMRIKLFGKAVSFHSWVGVDDEVGKKGSVDFQVFVDGVKRADTGTIHGGDPAQELNVDLKGARLVNLVVTEAGDGNSYDHADWADASFQLIDSKAKIFAQVVAKEPAMPIAHVDLIHTRYPRSAGNRLYAGLRLHLPHPGHGKAPPSDMRSPASPPEFA